MNILTIVQWTSYAIASFLLFMLPVRIWRLTKKIGECLLPFTRRKNPLYIAIIVLAVIMLVVVRFQEFSLVVAIVLHGTALLGLEISLREIIYRKMAGVYENFLIVDGRLLIRKHILAFPTLEYEQTPSQSLEILTKKNGTITVHFDSELERSKAVSVLSEWIK